MILIGKMQLQPIPLAESFKNFFPPIKVNKKIEPQKIYPTKNGKWIVDMGENFTGTYYIRLSGKKETK